MTPPTQRLLAPVYSGKKKEGVKLGLAVESMKRHMTNEGWELFAGLEHGGFKLCGHALTDPSTDVADLCLRHDPSVLVLQDKREWEGLTAGHGFDNREAFTNVKYLKERHDIFKITVLKDAQNNLGYHRQSADEIDCHAWIVYYLPSRVATIAPYVRSRHLIRMYHTIDRDTIPVFSPEGRGGVLLSGAISAAYPLRTRLFREVNGLPQTTALKHPGYHRNGSATPGFLQTLSKYKVAICTASQYGYALRKIVEATAAGCMVLTDLPRDDKLPEIDGNLTHISPTLGTKEIASLLYRMLANYDADTQYRYSQAARLRYDYRTEGIRLAAEIDRTRREYDV